MAAKSSFTIKEPSAAQSWLVAKSAAEVRTDRVNGFIYGPPRSRKSHFGLTFPDPIILDTDDNLLTYKGMRVDAKKRGEELPDVPYIEITDLHQLIQVARNPEILRQALTGKWEGYDFKSIVVDTISTPSDWELLRIAEADGTDVPEIQHYKPLAMRMRPLFLAFKQMKYNTLFISHDYDGGIEMRIKGQKAKAAAPPGPSLTGQLRKQAPGLADFFLYFRAENVHIAENLPPKVKYMTYRVPTADGYPAGVRGADRFLPEKWENATYQDLRNALDQLEKEAA